MSVRKIVVDTNVIVSALLGASYPKKIIAAWISGQLQVVVDDHLKAELNSVLRRAKIRKTLGARNFSAIRVIVGSLMNQAETVNPGRVSIRSFSDENDHFLLELAVGAKAAALVTGDLEILKVKRVYGIEILDPKTFCEKFNIK